MGHALAFASVATTRLRDRRRFRRSPRGAIQFSVPELSLLILKRSHALLENPDVRQFATSFAGFFTATMIFLA